MNSVLRTTRQKILASCIALTMSGVVAMAATTVASAQTTPTSVVNPTAQITVSAPARVSLGERFTVRVTGVPAGHYAAVTVGVFTLGWGRADASGVATVTNAWWTDGEITVNVQVDGAGPIFTTKVLVGRPRFTVTAQYVAPATGFRTSAAIGRWYLATPSAPDRVPADFETLCDGGPTVTISLVALGNTAVCTGEFGFHTITIRDRRGVYATETIRWAANDPALLVRWTEGETLQVYFLGGALPLDPGSNVTISSYQWSCDGLVCTTVSVAPPPNPVTPTEFQLIGRWRSGGVEVAQEIRGTIVPRTAPPTTTIPPTTTTLAPTTTTAPTTTVPTGRIPTMILWAPFPAGCSGSGATGCTTYSGVLADLNGRILPPTPYGVIVAANPIRPGFIRLTATFSGNALYLPSVGTREIRIPQATIEVLGGLTVGTPLQVRVSLADPETGAPATARIDSVIITNNTPGGAGAGASGVTIAGSQTFSFNGLAAGSYTVSVRVPDTVGFVLSTTFTLPLTIGSGNPTTTVGPTTTVASTTTTPAPTTTKPGTSAAISRPANNATVGSPVFMQIANPTNVARVDWVLNGVPIGSDLTPADPFTFDARGWGAGPFTLTAVVVDTSWRTSTTPAVIFRVA